MIDVNQALNICDEEKQRRLAFLPNQSFEKTDMTTVMCVEVT